MYYMMTEPLTDAVELVICQASYDVIFRSI